ncbi:MAG: TetR family transcriptional regulator [Gammaproteobacteria bacterium]
MVTPSPIPLRERKHAQTKLALMRAALEGMERRPLEEVPVKDLCDTAMVSEATFFNYFPRKSDVLAYYSQLWTLELGWHGRQTAARTPGLPAIEEVFRQAARRVQERPGVMGEVIAYHARQRQRAAAAALGRAERALAFPDLAGIEEIPVGGLEVVLVPNLQYAIEHGALPPNTHLHSVMVALVALFYGTPLALMRSNPAGVAGAYAHQLLMLWNGVRATAGARQG